jgi:hypothetical protein
MIALPVCLESGSAICAQSESGTKRVGLRGMQGFGQRVGIRSCLPDHPEGTGHGRHPFGAWEPDGNLGTRSTAAALRVIDTRTETLFVAELTGGSPTRCSRRWRI